MDLNNCEIQVAFRFLCYIFDGELGLKQVATSVSISNIFHLHFKTTSFPARDGAKHAQRGKLDLGEGSRREGGQTHRRAGLGMGQDTIFQLATCRRLHPPPFAVSGVHITGDLTAYAHENQIQEYRKTLGSRTGTGSRHFANFPFHLKRNGQTRYVLGSKLPLFPYNRG